MPLPHYSPMILFALRKAGAAGLPISVLRHSVEDLKGERIRGLTEFGHFVQEIQVLLQRGFVTVDAAPNSASEQIALVRRFRHGTGNVWEIVGDVERHAAHYILKIADEFFQAQESIGFSLTDAAQKQRDNTIAIRPMFGPPSPRKLDVFVVMPFSKEFDLIYQMHIKNVCAELGLSVERGDDVFGSSHIVSDIWSAIYNAAIVIADCSGKNANVFYELGIAHTLGKSVVLLARAPEDIPFDTRHLRHLVYGALDPTGREFEAKLKLFLTAKPIIPPGP